MKLTDERTGETFVTRDWAHSAVELHIGDSARVGARIIRLTNEEARRLAALILFQAARLEPPSAAHDRPGVESERKSA